jgi:argininosuccinate lyase
MPQKRNPDAAELVRAKVGRILGKFVAIASVLKGLPLAYAKDLQEDKEALFDAADSLELALAAMSGMVADWRVNKEAMRAQAEVGYPTATDLADWITRVLGEPFRAAHRIAGTIVKRAEELNLPLERLPLEELRKTEPGITNDVYSVLSVAASINSRQSLGGTAPARVREQIAFWRERLKE